MASSIRTTPASSEYTYITVRRKLMIIICPSLRLGKKWPCTQAPKVVQRYLQGYDSCRGTCVHNYFFGQSLATKQSKKRVAMVMKFFMNRNLGGNIFTVLAAANTGHSSTVGRLCARSSQLCVPKLACGTIA